MTNTPPEVLEKWRQEFEIWHMLKYGYLGCYEMSGIVYQRHDVESRWCTWKEARQTVVIELPNADHILFDTKKQEKGFIAAIEYVKELLEESGYSVEVKSD